MGEEKGFYLMDQKPAERFEDAWLLGNGTLGAAVMGGIACEKICLNADTLWSGQESMPDKPDFYSCFRKAQTLAMRGAYKEASEIIEEEMEGVWGEVYLPMADVFLTFGQKDNRRNRALRNALERGIGDVGCYERILKLREALAGIKYETGGVQYRREIFVSHPANVAVCWLEVCGGSMDFALSVDSALKHMQYAQYDGNGNVELFLKGIAPDHAEPSYTTVKPALVYRREEDSDALRFAVRIRICETDGMVWTDGTRIYVNNASHALVLISGKTNYQGYRRKRERSHEPLLEELERCLTAAQNKGYNRLREEHICDVSQLYDRVDIWLGEGLMEEMPIEERLERNNCLEDPSLYALVVQYARYLTIAASRKGSQPMNLQGIWNTVTDPPWACNYTTNINVQMNYWCCETLGLGECHEPLLRMIGELADSGKKTAEYFYHMSGWVAHHNVDLWRLSVPSCEDASWSWWPFGSSWLCQHLYTHYQFSRDKAYLQSIYSILRECVRFLLDFLIEGEDGVLMTAPSVSPENKHLVRGKCSYSELLRKTGHEKRFSSNLPYITAVTKSSTMDITLIREVFSNFLEMIEILGEKEPLEEEVREAYRCLPPYRIGRFGQLQEWYEDEEECSPGMGHMSHLYGVYPGEIISSDDTVLRSAAAKSLLRRRAHGGLKKGWPAAWAVCLAARMGLTEVCADTMHTIGTGLGKNLLTENNWQIDCVLGWAAGIVEMLLQSQEGIIRLLPALPSGWREGSFHGFCARGGFRIDLAWKDGLPYEGCVHADADGTCRISHPALSSVHIGTKKYLPSNKEPGYILFECKAGECYRLLF